MTTSSLVTQILTMDTAKQQEILELCKVIQSLYSANGDQLVETEYVNIISHLHADLANLIMVIDNSIGIAKIAELVAQLSSSIAGDTVEVSIHTTNDLILSSIQSALPHSHIQSHRNDLIGVSIVSNSGKRYERSLEKDIDKLSR